MKYFELFGIPVQLKVDKNVIRKKYMELARQSHPDYFATKDASEQQQALDQSAMLNKALKTLTIEDELIYYVLHEKGLIQKDEKYNLPPQFLMDMMELNETISDAKMEGTADMGNLQGQLDLLQKELYATVANTVEHYQEGVTSEEELLQVKDYYFKKKYLDRLRQQLNGMS